MRKKFVAVMLMMCLILSLLGVPSYAAIQDPVILSIDTLKYGEGQNTLIAEGYFVNTSAKTVTEITNVQLEISDGVSTIASGTFDISKERIFTISVGAAAPWTFTIPNPVKGMDLSKAIVDSRVAYNSGVAPELTSGKKVYYNGSKIAFDVPPAVINGRLMIPARAVFEKMGCIIIWNDASKALEVTRNGKQVIITINSTVMMVDGKAVKLDVAPTIIDGRTLVPLRAISTALGAHIVYGATNEMAVVYE